jgi:RNase adapter protein RapZ
VVAEFLVVTGLSGAGRSQAAAVLEDLGWFVMDNLPRSLVAKVAELVSAPGSTIDRVVLVVGRAPHDDILPALRSLRSRGDGVRIVYLDCDTAELVRRYGMSRRPHPLAIDGRGLTEAIEAERHLLEEVKSEADVVIDTTGINIHQLKARLTGLFGGEVAPGVQISVESFGFKHGVPLDVDMVFDCRFIPNPYWVPTLRPLAGTDPEVSDHVLGQPGAQRFCEHVEQLLQTTLPHFMHEGRTFLSIAFGCTGGRHRSVAITEEVARRLRRAGHDPKVTHRDVER